MEKKRHRSRLKTHFDSVLTYLQFILRLPLSLISFIRNKRLFNERNKKQDSVPIEDEEKSVVKTTEQQNSVPIEDEERSVVETTDQSNNDDKKEDRERDAAQHMAALGETIEDLQKRDGQSSVDDNSVLDATVTRDLEEQFHKTIKQTLQDALRSSLETHVIPALQISCREMFEQIDTTLQKGLSEYFQQQDKCKHLKNDQRSNYHTSYHHLGGEEFKKLLIEETKLRERYQADLDSRNHFLLESFKKCRIRFWSILAGLCERDKEEVGRALHDLTAEFVETLKLKAQPTLPEVSATPSCSDQILERSDQSPSEIKSHGKINFSPQHQGINTAAFSSGSNDKPPTEINTPKKMNISRADSSGSWIDDKAEMDDTSSPRTPTVQHISPADSSSSWIAVKAKRNNNPRCLNSKSSSCLQRGLATRPRDKKHNEQISKQLN